MRIHRVLRSLSAACGAALLAAMATTVACAEPISTDRPDFVESSDVVGAGRLQIETGLWFERTLTDTLRIRHTTTPALLRGGLGETLELRLETDGFARRPIDDRATGQRQRDIGFEDVSFGLKWHVQDGDPALGTPAMAWLAHVDIDSGTRAFRGDGWRPSLRLVAEWELPGDVGLGLMPGLLLDRNDAHQRFAAGILSVTVSKGLAPGWRGFVELAGQQLARERDGGSVLTLDAGLTWLLDDDLLLDLSGARGLTRASPDWQWGVGVSVRF